MIIAYHSQYSSFRRIYISEYRSGTWTHPSGGADFISLNENNNASKPRLSMGNNGEAVILWQLASTPYRLYISEYRSGSWSGPANVNDFIDPSDCIGVIDYHAAMNSNGDVLLAYEETLSGGGQRIFISEYSSGSWDHPADSNAYISPDGGNWAGKVQCDLADNGNAIIAWTQGDASTNNYIQISENRNSTWDHPSGLTDNIISPDGDADAPFVCNNNDFTSILWLEGDKLFLYESR